MRTNEERILLIQKRTAQLNEEKLRQKHLLEAGLSVAACFGLILVLGMQMPGWMAGILPDSMVYPSGTASLLGSHPALGYILIGILAFFLGVCVTILLYQIRDRRKETHQEEREDEL